MKKTTIVIAILLVTLALSGCFKRSEQVTQEPTQETETVQRAEDATQEGRTTDRALEDTDNDEISAIEDMIKDREEDQNNYDKYVERGREKDCDMLNEETSVQECKDEIRYNAAIEAQSISKCRDIESGSLRSECELEVREQTESESEV